MNRKSIETSIKSHERRMEDCVKFAKAYIEESDFEMASWKLAEANGHKEAIRELEFILECMEIEPCVIVDGVALREW